LLWHKQERRGLWGCGEEELNRKADGCSAAMVYWQSPQALHVLKTPRVFSEGEIMKVENE